MSKKVENLHWPDAPDMWMPYAPAIKVTGGSMIFCAGVTAAPVYHHHPHIAEEFDAMPDEPGQARLRGPNALAIQEHSTTQRRRFRPALGWNERR